ncbi:MAG: DNA gyrase inhibitor YacG [Pseudomonadota bacterium]
MSKEPAADSKVVPLSRKGGKCPICKAPSIVDYRPFCSRRCSDLDLGRWLKGTYKIPGDPADLPDDGRETDDDFS